MFVPVVPPQASPAALDLGNRIVRSIEEYRQLHPELSARDIYMALRIARQSTGAQRVNPAALALIGLLFAGWIAIVLVRDKAGPRGAESMPFIVVAIAIVLVAFLVLTIIRRQ